MSDPKRLSQGTSFEAELLSAARREGLSRSEKAAIWASVAAEVALPSAASASAGSATSAGSSLVGNAGTAPGVSSALSGAGLVKSVIATGLALTLGASGYALLRRAPRAATLHDSAGVPVETQARPAAPTPGADVTSSDVAPTNEGRAESSAVEMSPSLAPGASGEPRRLSPSARSGSASAVQASSLREESLLILEARRALRSGDFTSTLQRLEEVRARFPRGALVQEREALTVEALGRSGARAAAERRARTFLRNYPNSPYAADVERYANP